ncbi:isochorismatase family protein [Brevibacillus porteri]|uniref:Isochorismatase n=1 Tax=Brevibacillus porteri TaxID=2126350 RepID=A0ABX5FVZ1_9BACL|nr:isochorismatase family protein [Brevibacillus porteri]MED1798681.1 isochorismatase family protein [Brevibacillus porteri]MED2131364.1 isochorismatase family protein [Brevibacillus porteri]MED2743918.1 isochorismatase family protein [Brevibacillus porteri]MED2813647.1 isochorismatase family protein [Brevibacillus porteri]MED2892859.1 isochorismatase family protein [Brevibacillus porteri]
MKALLVIDVQNGIVSCGDYKEELFLMEQVIKDFKESNCPVIFVQHVDDAEESPLKRGSIGSEIHSSLKDYSDFIIEKQTPSSFFQTELTQTLEKLGVDHLFIIGFETEFCCMFTAIAAYDRGYNVTFIKDATGTTNTAESYSMQGLDVKQFVGTVLRWSSVIEVVNYTEYTEKYK